MLPSRTFLYLCIAFISGVAFDLMAKATPFLLFVCLSGGLLLISVYWRKHVRIVVAGFCLLVFVSGAFRSSMVERPKDSLEYYKTHPQSSGGNIPFVSGANFFRKKLSESIDRSLAPPQGSLLGAIMLGEQERLSKDLKGKLNVSGTRHITSVSGTNVVILGSALIGLGLVLGLYRGQAFYLALFGIILFIAAVGAPPSALRAGIMGGIILFAEKMGRLAQGSRLILIAAVCMLLFNPLLLRFDIGFQLSFLATLGIGLLSPWLREKLRFIPKFFEMRNTVAMTIPAILFTAPILASNFGQISLVSLFSNILIVPVIPPLLGFGFLAALLGTLFPILGQIAFAPVWLIGTYIYKVIDISARVPFATVRVESFPRYLVFGSLLLFFAGMAYVKRRGNMRAGGKE